VVRHAAAAYGQLRVGQPAAGAAAALQLTAQQFEALVVGLP
jgi:hypothetical protein